MCWVLDSREVGRGLDTVVVGEILVSTYDRRIRFEEQQGTERSIIE